MRDFQKLKSLDDFEVLDTPKSLEFEPISPADCPYEKQMILRMLIKGKYNKLMAFPRELDWLESQIISIKTYDEILTGIDDSWIYVTVRHGPLCWETDDEWHFDGASLRTELIPERNYIFTSAPGFEYMEGTVVFRSDFDPVKHNLFQYVKSAAVAQTRTAEPDTWYLVTPFVFHRRPEMPAGTPRTFVRITFPDIEIRDVNNTINPHFPTRSFGRDPVKSFRDGLARYEL